MVIWVGRPGRASSTIPNMPVPPLSRQPDALAELGTVPKSAAKALWDWWATNPVIDVDAIDAIDA